MGKDKGRKRNQQKKQLDPSCSASISTPDDTESTTEEKSDGRISLLPDEILCFVTSLLPFKSAVKTSFLSTRWKSLWKMGLVGDGNLQDAIIALSKFLNGFDELHRSKNIRGLQFNFGRGNILLAAVSPNNTLHLEFSTGKQEFPRQFGWQLDLNSQNFTHQPSPSTFYVKTLHLVSVSYLTSEAVSYLVSDFPFLESLTIAKCNGLRSLSIDACSRIRCSRLRNLTVFDCLQLKSFFIYEAFRLRSFRYRGLLPWFHLDVDLHLFDAMLDFRKGPAYSFKSDCFASVLRGIVTATTLTLCRWTFEKLIYPRICGRYHRCHVEFDNLEELWWIDYGEDEKYNSDALVFFLKLCPSLETLAVTIDSKSYRVPNTDKLSTKVTSDTKLKQLKNVKLDGFTNEEDEVSLAKQLKEVFFAEPKIVATSRGGNCWRSLVKVPELQEAEFSFKFVKDLRHINYLFPKHPHMAF